MGQTATRSPSINELFAPQVTSLDNLATDPCQKDLINVADAGKAGTLSNLCKLTGVPDKRIGSVPAPSASQINVLGGGNPKVGPEKAKTTTLGFTFAPSQVKNLTMSVDYWDIRLTDTISNPSVDDIVSGCYSAKLNPTFANNAFCQLVHRDTVATGSLNGDARGVEQVQANLGKQNTSGIDLAAGYGLPLAGLGDLNFSFMLTKVTKYNIQPTPNSAERDCLGKYSVSCGAPNPKVKFSQGTDWRFGDFSVGYNWRYIGGTKVEATKGILPDYQEIKATNYVDLSGVWKATKQVRLTLTVKNLFDKAPPILGSSLAGTSVLSGNTFPQTYDAIGRYFTVGANVTF
jgi:outer membrane receptor protein involved in Fe transport